MNGFTKFLFVMAAACVGYYVAGGVFARFGVAQAWIWLAAAAGLAVVGLIRVFLPPLPRALRATFWGAVCLGLAALLFLCGLVATRMNAKAPDGARYVIVLGAHVEGTKPSPALQHRIDAAYEYLARNPDAVCIGSGGQGADEGMAEGDCIRDALVQMGIDPARVLSENQSTSTAENFAYSLALIGDAHQEVAFVSNNFHIYRAEKIARSAGFTNAHGIACEFRDLLLPHFIVREALGLIAETLRGTLTLT